jgi:hypothetical protein
MQKNQSTKIILIAAFFAFALNLFFGRYLTAKFSTLPLLNRFKILSPQAPIVINNTQEVRVSDNVDYIKAFSQFKPKLNSVFILKNNQPIFLTSGVNLTNDGIVLIPLSNFSSFKVKDLVNIFVKFSDGNFVKVNSFVKDSYANLAYLKTEANNLSVINFADSKQLEAAQKLLVANLGINDQNFFFKPAFVSEILPSNKNIYSDLASTDFNITLSEKPNAGAAVVNLNGELAGIWDGENVISSREIKNSWQAYLSNSQNLRPAFGFSYKIPQNWEAQILGIKTSGALVVNSDNLPSSQPAFKAGLRVGDVITHIDSVAVKDITNVEELLQKHKPNEKVEFTVARGAAIFKLQFISGELK